MNDVDPDTEKSDSSDSSHDEKRRRAIPLVEPLVILVAIATLIAFLARVNWVFELGSHFRVQYMCTAGLCACLIALSRRWKMFWFATLIFMLNAAVVLPVYWPCPTAVAGPSSIKILSANLYVGNSDFGALQKLIDETDPDVIIFSESHAAWMDQLEPLKHDYPQSVVALNGAQAFSISAFSRIDLARFEIVLTGEPSVPSVLIETELDGQPIRIIGAHTFPPGRRANLIHRNNQLMAVAKLAIEKEKNVPCAVVGDLNISPWSPYFSDFLNAGKLRDSRRGHGNHASWPADSWFLKIPIDHCVTQAGIVVKRREICRNIGSDHSPLLVELALEAE